MDWSWFLYPALFLIVCAGLLLTEWVSRRGLRAKAAKARVAEQQGRPEPAATSGPQAGGAAAAAPPQAPGEAAERSGRHRRPRGGQT